MENASKALIMAGGMLLAGLMITLIVYVWSSFSEYQDSRDELKNIADTTKFNQEFANYNRDDVLGYEVLSVLNKVIDYNERRSSDTKFGNDEKFPPVKISIKLDSDGSDTNRKNLIYYKDIQLFTEEEYSDQVLTNTNITSGGVASKRYSFADKIEDKMRSLSLELGLDEKVLTNMAKNISTIFKTDADITSEASNVNNSMFRDEPDEEARKNIVKMMMVSAYNSYVKDDLKVADIYDTSNYDSFIINSNRSNTVENKITTKSRIQIENLYIKLCQYYEYIQFKRGIFKCTGIEYDKENTGRVISISFEFTGKIK